MLSFIPFPFTQCGSHSDLLYIDFNMQRTLDQVTPSRFKSHLPSSIYVVRAPKSLLPQLSLVIYGLERVLLSYASHVGGLWEYRMIMKELSLYHYQSTSWVGNSGFPAQPPSLLFLLNLRRWECIYRVCQLLSFYQPFLSVRTRARRKCCDTVRLRSRKRSVKHCLVCFCSNCCGSTHSMSFSNYKGYAQSNSMAHTLAVL